MRFHLIGLNHLPILKEIQPCAFTQKVWKMAKMLMANDHEVYIYGVGPCDAPCTEFIQLLGWDDVQRTFGMYDWKKENFRTDFGNEKPSSQMFIAKAIREINKRKQPDDFLLLSMGTTQKPIADGVGLYLTVEFGIGYRASWAPFRAFESEFLRSYQYGVENAGVGDIVDGKNYDRVIPNYFDLNDFQAMEPDVMNPYVAFVGRMISRKGIQIAHMAAKEAGVKLMMAGQGAEWVAGRLKCVDIELENHPKLHYVGTLGVEDRNQLMGEASAVLVPTIYMEPFGGVNVESQLCGTPAITSNYGAFPETVLHGRTGYRCDTLQDYVTAIHNCLEGKTSASKTIRAHAEKYSIENVGLMFEKWWEELYEVYLSTKGKSHGWGQLIDGPRPSAPKKQTWEEAQAWESDWWGTNTKDFTHTFAEEQKQYQYMALVGLTPSRNIGGWVELEPGTSVLDIGSNAVSFLFKCRGHEHSHVVDPLELPMWALEKYAAAGINYEQMKAEELLDSHLSDAEFDEVWIYNCLQHVDDPRAIVAAAKVLGKRIRIVEWIDIGVCDGHIHNLTAEDLSTWFGVEGQVTNLVPEDEFGCQGNVWHAVIDL